MSSHHIVREKQEPALLIMSLEGFEDENLGQILEWRPTVIVHEDIYEETDSMAFKIDAVVTKNPQLKTQESTNLIITDTDPLEGALKFLVGEQYPAVNVIINTFVLKDYALFVEEINIVVFIGNKKIYPVKSGFSKHMTLMPFLKHWRTTILTTLIQITRITSRKLSMPNLVMPGTPLSYNTRLTRIRDFYDYLRKEGVRVKALFPARSVHKRYQNQDNNFLSHTSHRSAKTYVRDHGHKRTTLKEVFKDEVISIKAYGDLYRALKQIDVVYAVIAQVMMQTFLRIADVCEMPLHYNKYNPYLPLWLEFERSGKELLRYSCLTKGMKQVTIDIYPVTLQAVYEDYIQPCCQERRQLFNSVYMKRCNATLELGNIRDNGRRRCPEDILWLTETGAPVKPYMVESAFRATGLGINPHMLRHTGATHTLWNYCRIHGIEPDVRLASTFQEILQEQMGHADIQTTRKYVRTIIALKGRRTMPFCIPRDKAIIDDRLAEKIKGDVADQIARFFEYLTSPNASKLIGS